MAFIATMATKTSQLMRRRTCSHLGMEHAEAGAGVMLVACRLAGVSALVAHYAGDNAQAQFGVPEAATLSRACLLRSSSPRARRPRETLVAACRRRQPRPLCHPQDFQARPTLPAGRFPPSGLLGKGGNVDQRCNQPQQRLMFRPVPFSQESAQFDVGQSSSGRSVGLMDNEGMTGLRLPTQEPGIAVWAAVKLSPF